MVNIISRLAMLMFCLIAANANAQPQSAVTISSDQAWQRQEVVISAEIRSQDRYAQINWPVLPSNDYDHYQHTTTLTVIDKGDSKLFVRHLKISLFFYATGQRSLRLPDIEYIRGGRIQHFLAVPELTISIKPLPIYIPPNMPVGKVNMISSDVTGQPWWLRPDTVYIWKINFQGNGVPAKTLPFILKQINSDTSQRFYTASTEQDTLMTTGKLTGKKSYQIPFSVSSSGFTRLPEIRWQYFDPLTGKIIDKSYTPRKNLVLSWPWMISILLVVSMVSRKMIIQAVYSLRRKWHYYYHRNMARKKLTRAVNVSDINEALTHYAFAQEWPENLSHQAWLALYKSAKHMPSSLVETIGELDRMQYSNSSSGHGGISAINQSLLKAI